MHSFMITIYLIQIFFTQLCGFEYSYPILIIYTRLYVFLFALFYLNILTVSLYSYM